MPANYTHTTRAAGLTLTATIYNQDHQNHIDNMIPSVIDDHSTNTAQMQQTSDPGELGTESPATSLAGEIERLRFVLKELKGTTHWYQSVSTAIAFLGANTFTALQRIVRAVAGNFLELESTEAGANSGPDIELYRNSVSPAADDFGGRINFYFKDSAGNKEFGGRIYSKLTDPTNGSEDTVVGISSIRAGVISEWAFARGALSHTSLTTPVEDGAINAVKHYVNNLPIGQHCLQKVTASTATFIDNITGDIPDDNTIPLVAEGTQVLTQAFTPRFATSTIVIKILLNVGNEGVNSHNTTALFKGSTCVAAAQQRGLAGEMKIHELYHEEAAVDVAARTYSVRIGPDSTQSINLNGKSSARVYGGVAKSYMVIEEWVTIA